MSKSIKNEESLAIIIHLGAGKFNIKKKKHYEQLCQKAIKKGYEIFNNTKPLEEVLVEVIKVLEESELTNAGHGSNLTLTGSVECDASILSINSNSTLPFQFGSIGAVPNIKYPIALAYEVLKLDQPKGLGDGRITPLLLCGSQALNLNLDLKVKQEELISELALEKFTYYKNLINNNNNNSNNNSNNSKRDRKSYEFDKEIHYDTIGAIVFNLNTLDMVVGVSSGGILLKLPGRIGEAAIYGAGCWASQAKLEPNENEDIIEMVGSGCSTSGTGEAIIQNQFSKKLVEKQLELLKKDELESSSPILAIQNQMKEFLDDENIKRRYIKDHHAVGSILLSFKAEICKVAKNIQLNQLELIIAHTTHSMIVAYFTSKTNSVKFVMSKKTQSQNFQIDLIPCPF